MEESVVEQGYEDVFDVTCPHCFTRVELFVDPTSRGTLVEDCAVCCRPWEIRIGRDADGHPHLNVTRS
jgi:hypothetical protein